MYHPVGKYVQQSQVIKFWDLSQVIQIQLYGMWKDGTPH